MAFPEVLLAITSPVTGFIPSPSRGVVHIGPIPLRAYALCILAGVFAAIALARRRWVARGGAEHTIADLAVWTVPAGLVGARLYHVATDYQLYTHDPLGAFKVWDGGLGIWGGVAGGMLAGLWLAHRWHLDFAALLDTVAPALPLAQAIGRLGNWFNQELFGRPTTLPWGLRIDVANRPAGYTQYSTFHPTFLYELLWNLVVVAIVLAVERRYRLKPGRLFAVYVAAYTFGRFWTESLRIDPAHRIGGLRLNDWTSVAVFVVAMGFVLTGRRPALASSAGEGRGSDHRHQVEEAVGEHGGTQPPAARGDAEHHPGGPDGDDHGDVGPAVERVEVGQAEDHGLGGHGADRAEGVEQGALDHAPEEELLDDRGTDHGQQGDHHEAGGVVPEDLEDLVVGPGESLGGGQDGEHRHTGGEAGAEGHERTPSDAGAGDAHPQVVERPPGAEAPAHLPHRADQPGPQPGLGGEEAGQAGDAHELAGQAEPDGGSDSHHHPDEGDQQSSGRQV